MIAYMEFWLVLFGLGLGVCLLALCLFVAIVVIESWGGASVRDRMDRW